jgi:para-nitrobenzyl esterase
MKRWVVLFVTLGIAAGCAPTPKVQLGGIGDTSWQLVKFQGGNGTVLTPDDRTKYTLAFTNDGYVSVRFDCNRGRGTWILNGPNELRFGPLALTRAMCPPGSLHDHFVKQWPFVRAYTLKGGHLFLALAADAGSYEFEPMR